MEFSAELLTLAARAESKLSDIFAEIDKVSFDNTAKIMDAFREHRVSDAMFNPTSG